MRYARLKTLTHFPFYPFLWGLYFFLHIYSVNVHEHPRILDLLLLAGLSLTGIGMALLIQKALLGDWNKAAFLTAVLTFLFFSFGMVKNAVRHYIPVHDSIFLFFYAVLFAASVFYGAWKGKGLGRYVLRLNLLALVVVLMPLGSIVYYKVNQPRFRVPPEEAGLAKIATDKPMTSRPDVYFILLDEYPRKDVLARFFGYDNSGFIKFLESLGFYVASESHSNYLKTSTSLPATLNMQYLDFLGETMGDSKDKSLVTAMVFDNHAAKIFKKLGYRYIVVDSGATPTNDSPLADTVISYSPFAAKELHVLMANTTVAKPAMKKFLNDQFRQRHLYNFEALKKIPEIEGPKFVLAHMIVPHTPFVFDRTGAMPEVATVEFNPQGEVALSSEGKQLFLDQLIYLNEALKEILVKIIQKSETRPVIILQGDHGPMPEGEWAPTARFLAEAAPILNAFYLPPEAQKHLYPSISSVNTFRFLFDHVFGAEFGLLEDKVYFADYEKTPFRFTEVTGIFHGVRED